MNYFLFLPSSLLICFHLLLKRCSSFSKSLSELKVYHRPCRIEELTHSGKIKMVFPTSSKPSITMLIMFKSYFSFKNV